jgi:hypothetical protein
VNTKWWYDHKTISVAIRGIEIFIGVEMIAYYLRYATEVKRVIKRKKVKSQSNYNSERLIKRVTKKHTKVKVDMLFAGTLSYLIMIVVTRIVSYATFRYAHFIDTFFINSIIQGALHIGMLFVPHFLWDIEEVNKFFNDVLNWDGINDYTAGTHASKPKRAAR